jgi:hypothetical protein
MPLRLAAALAAYALLGISAWLTLPDVRIRVATLLLLAGLALKTVLGWKARS